jgi:hypothetical protein
MDKTSLGLVEEEYSTLLLQIGQITTSSSLASSSIGSRVLSVVVLVLPIFLEQFL